MIMHLLLLPIANKISAFRYDLATTHQGCIVSCESVVVFENNPITTDEQTHPTEQLRPVLVKRGSHSPFRKVRKLKITFPPQEPPSPQSLPPVCFYLSCFSDVNVPRKFSRGSNTRALPDS